ncbi:hypothetical protein [Spirosoma endbachense]|uniref:Uncharacterized protein n=1 Tax=Spirosoma endbachense TaxID=2666025 RepID=A0A6P1W0N9_9BACT|nr:hypothetical protein [Spirosoma endbachense]QHV97570.1 hypothetical protein GJR95_22300 [Spirosoma endbachense]
MAKTFTPITQAGPIQAPVTAKTTLINSSSANLFVTSDELDDAMSELSISDKNAVLNALYAVKPGGSLALSAGTYNLSFANKYAQSAVLLVDIKA